MKSRRKLPRGFSLLELAVVLLLSSLMAGVVVRATSSSNKLGNGECYTATKLQLAEIRGAVERFVRANNRLPRPARRDRKTDATDYGREVAMADLGVTVTRRTDAGGKNIDFGALPFATLGLPASYGGDCWGNKLTYIVTENLTKSDAVGGFQDEVELGVISLRKTTTTVINNAIAYAIVSHGEDGLGAAKVNQVNGVTWCMGGATTITNTNCRGANNAANTAVVIDAEFNNGKNAAAGNSYFDDVVAFGIKPPMLEVPTNLYCWGNNASGQVGDGATGGVRLEPVAVTLPGPFSGYAYFTKVATGKDHSCGLVEGRAYCWGLNSNKQLGDGGAGSSTWPVAVTMPAGVFFKQIAAGEATSYALGYNGRLYCWGRGGNYCGGGGDVSVPTLVNVGALPVGDRTFKHIASGYQRACAISMRDNLFCWGASYLGDNTTNPSSTPRAVDVGALAAGEDRKFRLVRTNGHSCAITMAGNTYCWGDNSKKQMNSGGTADFKRPSPSTLISSAYVDLAVGEFHSCGLTAGLVAGTNAYCWGQDPVSGAQNATPVAVAGGYKFTSISASGSSSCGRTLEDKIYCWGQGANGQIGNSSASNQPTPVAAANTGTKPMYMQTMAQGGVGSSHRCAIADADYAKRLVSNEGLGSLYLKDDGEIWYNKNIAAPWIKDTTSTGWKSQLQGGYITSGSLGMDGIYYGASIAARVFDFSLTTYTPPTLIKFMSAGYMGFAAIDKYDKLWWRHTTVHPWISPYPVTSMGTLVLSIKPASGNPLPGSHFFEQLHAHYSFLCGITLGGDGYCYRHAWADPEGWLGTGVTNDTAQGRKVAGGGVWRQIVVNRYSACGIKLDHTLWCWGQNSWGQLGVGSVDGMGHPTPQQVGTMKWKNIGASVNGLPGDIGGYFCGVTLSGDGYCWGSNDPGDGDACINANLGSADNEKELAPKLVSGGRKWLYIQPGALSTCGVTSNKQVYCWGGADLTSVSCTTYGPTPVQQSF